MCNCKGKCKVCHCNKAWVAGFAKDSYWGVAGGQHNIIVFECDNPQEAQAVKENCMKRGDMKGITVFDAPPTFNCGLFHISQRTKADVPSMYREAITC